VHISKLTRITLKQAQVMVLMPNRQTEIDPCLSRSIRTNSPLSFLGPHLDSKKVPSTGSTFHHADWHLDAVQCPRSLYIRTTLVSLKASLQHGQQADTATTDYDPADSKAFLRAAFSSAQ
jgi:hypothetical protein